MDYIVWAVCGLLGVGLGAWLLWEFITYAAHFMLYVLPILLGAVIIAIGPLSYGIAHSMVKAQAVGGYQQTLTTSLVSVDKRTVVCSKEKEDYGGSNCSHTEQCDSYTELESYTETDSKGNTTIKTRSVTKWYDCPLASHECTYDETDVFGNVYVIAGSIMCPESVELRSSIAGISRTPPQRWTQDQQAWLAGDSPSVTVLDEYENYILGSEAEMLIEHSTDIETLKKANLLPLHTADLTSDRGPIHSFNRADKMAFVGFTPPNTQMWQEYLMRFNAMFGMTRQGDLHIVAVKASLLPVDPVAYRMALKAYWQGELKKQALAKNAVMLVLGIDDTGTNITWAQADTGMPIGNDGMKDLLLMRLPNLSFSPDVVLGKTTARIIGAGENRKPQYTSGGGEVAKIMMEEMPFERPCMRCDDADEKGKKGFVNLMDAIPITGRAVFWTIIIDIVIAGVLTFGTAFLGGYIADNYGVIRNRQPHGYY